MREICRFYWPVLRRLLPDIWEALHQSHTAVYFMSLLLALGLAHLSQRGLLELIGWIALGVTCVVNFLVSVYKHHRKLLKDQEKTIQAPLIQKRELILQELQSLRNFRASLVGVPANGYAEVAQRAILDQKIADLEQQL